MSSTIFSGTIYALASAAGKSGVAIFRVSGPQALAALHTLSDVKDCVPRHAYYLTFYDPANGEVIDRGLGLYFPAPHSFTGEDIVECHLHGSRAVIKHMLDVLGQVRGLRPAEAGEFAKRAFINGKMDLLEAEGLADLIDAETNKQKSQALRQMQGEVSFAYDHLRNGIIECLALLEAYIDFPDEEIPESVLTSLDGAIMGLQGNIKAMLGDKRGERLREGINVVILGAPNAGKSSLLNTIAKRDVAIVSHRPGTTRDIIEIHVDMAGYPVVFVDTAGLRESDDDIEAEGIRRARERAGAAELKLIVFDGEHWPQMDNASQQLVDANSIVVVNKCDLLISPSNREESIFISTQTGEGIDRLLQYIEQRISADYNDDTAAYITRSRHRTLLLDTLNHLEKSINKLNLELRCEELRLSAFSLGKITGKIAVDDVLDVIFSRFCIGK